MDSLSTVGSDRRSCFQQIADGVPLDTDWTTDASDSDQTRVLDILQFILDVDGLNERAVQMREDWIRLCILHLLPKGGPSQKASECVHIGESEMPGNLSFRILSIVASTCKSGRDQLLVHMTDHLQHWLTQASIDPRYQVTYISKCGAWMMSLWLFGVGLCCIRSAFLEN